MYGTYQRYSLDGLFNLASAHLSQISQVNSPRDRLPAAYKRAPGLKDHCASYSEGNLNLDFNSKVIQGVVAGDLVVMEGVIEEGWFRLDHMPALPLDMVNLLVDLEREVKVFLDNARGTACLNVNELMDLSCLSCRELVLSRS